METLLWLVAGLVGGMLVMWLWAKGCISALQAVLQVRCEELAQKQAMAEALSGQKKALADENKALAADKQALVRELSLLREQMEQERETRQVQFEEQLKRVEAQLKNATQEV